MYANLPSFVLGFHGCDKSVTDQIINHKEQLKKSENAYDWLGHGIYFWENDPYRALNFAKYLKEHPERIKEGATPINEPSVIGAIIDLGHCLNAIEASSLEIIRNHYELLKETSIASGKELPKNRKGRDSNDLLVRDLDCAVIQSIHAYNDQKEERRSYDSVRGMFIEGDELYPNAGFRDKNHIQICVRNMQCVKGYFLPFL
ncbi:hypothetical protein [Paenibacillus whitsoniae]|uniref:Uncharacterized protein n=1 Tax=Paenibacillus whitsoniae TaxID=2496558 RepID=A0A430JB51_9BACL|nr:hypothetical protein [Paenibacillus whitsoniae]RTE08142.1 hypothetical protein EJQ19_18810 [Paenibacillus whitsoniae]